MIPRYQRYVRTANRGVLALLCFAFFFALVTMSMLKPSEVEQYYGISFAPPPPPVESAPIAWAEVTANNVLLWPTVKGHCRKEKALAQYNAHDIVMIVYRHGDYVEVIAKDTERQHRQGCIHESMLRVLNQ